jgi:hypothetical protein
MRDDHEEVKKMYRYRKNRGDRSACNWSRSPFPNTEKTPSDAEQTPFLNAGLARECFGMCLVISFHMTECDVKSRLSIETVFFSADSTWHFLPQSGVVSGDFA